MNRMGLVLSAVLAAALLALLPTPAGAVVPSLPGTTPGGAAIAQHMPKDSTVAIAINVSKLAQTGAFDAIEQMGGENAFDELKTLGIDIKKDISNVMIGLVIDPDKPDEPQVYIAIAGNLPPEDKLLKMYEEETGETPESRQVEGKTVYDMDEVDVCFLPGVVLLAVTEEGEADIAKMLAGPTGSLAASTELAPLLKGVNTKATVWAIASFSDALREVMGEDSEDAPFDISALKTIMASFDYADNVVLDVAMGFADEETPAAIVEMFNTQFKPMAQQMAEMMPAVTELVNAIQVNAAGSKATVKLSMPQEKFQSAVEGLFGMMFGAMMGGVEVEEEEGEEAEW